MNTSDSQVEPLLARVPTFADSSRTRLFLASILYLAQGLPQGVLFSGIAAWLAANGQSAAVVGSVFAAVSMPWAFKFVIGAIVDRYTFLAMGRRRSWLVGAQVCILACMLTFGFVNPSADQIPLVIAFAFVMSLLTATQDVALDAMVVDLTPEAEMGNVNGFMFGGKIVGIAIGSAATGYLSQHYGFNIALFAMAGAFLFPAAFALLVRERQGERLLPWTDGAASQANLERVAPDWLPILKTSLKSILKRDPLVVIFLSLMHGISQSTGDTLFPVMSSSVLAWDEAQFTGLQGMTNLILAPIAVLAGGLLVDRVGPMKVALIASLLNAAILVSYSMMQSLWADDSVFYALYIAAAAPALLAYLAMLVLFMRVCDPAVAATTFTLMTSAFAVGMSIGGMLAGDLEAMGGFQALLLFAGATIALSGLSSLFLSGKAGGAMPKEPGSDRAPDASGFPLSR